jgi:hypothetical protein
MLVFLLFFWLICGIVTLIVMTNKGLSGCAGFLLGFGLGPLGLVIGLVLPPNSAKAETTALRDGSMRQCPACAEPIRAEAVKCRYCGTDIAPLQITVEATPAAPAAPIAGDADGKDADGKDGDGKDGDGKASP